MMTKYLLLRHQKNNRKNELQVEPKKELIMPVVEQKNNNNDHDSRGHPSSNSPKPKTVESAKSPYKEEKKSKKIKGDADDNDDKNILNNESRGKREILNPEKQSSFFNKKKRGKFMRSNFGDHITFESGSGSGNGYEKKATKQQ